MFVFLFFFSQSRGVENGTKKCLKNYTPVQEVSGIFDILMNVLSVLDGVCEKLQVDHKHFKQFFLTSECILEDVEAISFIYQCYWFRIHHKEAKLLTFERWLRAKTCMIELLCYGKTYQN